MDPGRYASELSKYMSDLIVLVLEEDNEVANSVLGDNEESEIGDAIGEA